jgi:hypothetical protein
MTKHVSCGVIVTDGRRLLLGHATRSPRWDIPKGMVEPGESLIAAATRELYEETGLVATEADMRSLGVHAYLRDKDLALFAWQRPQLPEPDTLICESTFMLPAAQLFPNSIASACSRGTMLSVRSARTSHACWRTSAKARRGLTQSHPAGQADRAGKKNSVQEHASHHPPGLPSLAIEGDEL